MTKLSIITPLYNNSNFTEMLVETLEKQTSKEFEAIFVDDCSSDDTFRRMTEALENVSFKYMLLKMERNGGPGLSRNFALENVTGKYVTFLDSDDTLDEKTVEVLLEIISESNADAVMFDYYMGNGNKYIRRSTVLKQSQGFISVEDAMLYSTSGPLCKAYKTEILKKGCVRFPNMLCSEDFVFNKIALSQCHSVYYEKIPLYKYCIRSDSIVGTGKGFSSDNTQRAFSIVEQRVDSKYEEIINLLKIKEYLLAVTQGTVYADEKYGKIKNITDSFEKEYPKWYDDSKNIQLDKITKVLLFLLKYRLEVIFRIFVKIKYLLKSKLY